MSYSFTERTGDGTTVAFTFAFVGEDAGYYDEDDIQVEVDGVSTPFVLTGLNQITLSEAPASGATIRIMRVPNPDLPYTDFHRGNQFGEDNINRSFLKQLYLTHRLMDGFKDPDYYEKQDLSMGNHKIKDVTEPDLDTDVATKGYVDTIASEGIVVNPLTPSDIKEMYESNDDTNAFTDADKTNLSDALTAIEQDTNPKISADLDMDSHKIKNLASPTLDTDAANKGYVDNIETGEINVQADWDVTDNTSDAYIWHKPNISGTGEENVQSDWEVTDDSDDAYIKNKPFDKGEWMFSSGIIEGGEILEGTNAETFKVTAITKALLRATADPTAPLELVTMEEQDNQIIPAYDTVYYVAFTYGTPCTITLSTSPLNGFNSIPIGKVSKSSSDGVHFISGGYRFGDGVSKLHTRAMALRALELKHGASIAYSGTNNFTLSQGIAFGGINKYTLSAYDSATTQFTAVYNDGSGAWTEVKMNTIDYLHYDDLSGTLNTVSNNKYGVHYIFKHIDDQHVYVLYGLGSYSLSEAILQASQIPNAPLHLTEFGVFVGSIVIAQTGGSFDKILSSTDQVLNYVEVSNHANLNNLDYLASGHTGFANSGVNTNITSMIGLDDNAIPVSKIDGITGDEEKNVQADWAVTDDTDDAYIWHKPDLSGTGEMNVQVDWEVTDVLDSAYILNKPVTISDPFIVEAENDDVRITEDGDIRTANLTTLSLYNAAELKDITSSGSGKIITDTERSNLDANTEHRKMITMNPHQVTKAQIGLSDVPNTDFTEAVNLNTDKNSYPSADATKLAGIEEGAEVNNISDSDAAELTGGGDTTLHDHDGITENTEHRNRTDNPHAVTKTQIGLGTVPDTDFTNAVTANTSHRNTISGNPHAVTKTDIGLDNVEDGAQVNNISDANAAELTGGGVTALHSHDSGGSMDYPNAGIPKSTGTAWDTSLGLDTTDFYDDNKLATEKAIKKYGNDHWNGDSMDYPGVGIAKSTGTAWDTSLGLDTGNLTHNDDTHLATVKAILAYGNAHWGLG